VTVPDRPRVWRKASRSTNTDNCVEVALDQTVGVRDTKDRAGGELAVTGNAWRAFTATVRS
jgi:uncharacterized protein DUF397